MKKQILAALLVLPLAAFAQGPGPGAGSGPGPGAGPGSGRGQGQGQGKMARDPERLERRMRLARTLGLAEALDLDAPQALKLGEALAKFDVRRQGAQKQLREAHQALRKAADGEKATAQEVDQAIAKALEARAQLAAIDRETLQVVSKDLSPEQRARAVLFLDRFQKRFRGLGPDREEIRRGMRKRAGFDIETGRRAMAFRMQLAPPGDEDELVPPPPPEVMLFDDGEDDADVEIELER